MTSVRALRGATTVEADTVDDVKERTIALLQAMVESVSSGEQMGLGVVCVWGGGDVER